MYWRPLFVCTKCGIVTAIGEVPLPDTLPDRADGMTCLKCNKGKMSLCPYGCILVTEERAA